MDKKLVFFLDIDDTLMYRGVIPQENIDAILEAQAQGHKFFINTGRSYGFIPPEVKADIPFDGYISGIGSHVTVDGKEIVADHFDFDDFYEKLEPFAKAGIKMHIESIENVYALGITPFLYETVISSFDEIKKFRDERFCKATVFCQIADEDRARFTERYQLIQNPHFLEISLAGYTKASALKTIIEYLGVPLENTVAMGDALNDLPMLKAAGTSVTVANARDEVQKAADLVVPTAAEAGVAAAIKILTEKKG